MNSWIFYPKKDNCDVIDTKVLSRYEKDILCPKISNNNGINFVYGGKNIMFYYISKNGTEKPIVFNIERYPSCCGSTIFHNFYIDYMIPLEAIEKLSKLLPKQWTTNINCIVRDRETAQIKFLEKLGFKRKDSFTNRNTNRLLHFYMLNT